MRCSFEPGHRSQSGFTLVETMIAALIMAVGLMALAWQFITSMATVEWAQQDSIARQAARETLESILSSRNNSTVQYASIDNVGTGSGIFVVGWKSLLTEGPDAIFGTADDGTTGCASSPCVQSMTLPGPDGILGTADDVAAPLTGYKRQIVITDSPNGYLNIKQITVTVQYTTPSNQNRQVTVTTYVSPYV
jgi:prepilin-type N-terminal cleavage/methylation domain-containing protein